MGYIDAIASMKGRGTVHTLTQNWVPLTLSSLLLPSLLLTLTFAGILHLYMPFYSEGPPPEYSLVGLIIQIVFVSFRVNFAFDPGRPAAQPGCAVQRSGCLAPLYPFLSPLRVLSLLFFKYFRLARSLARVCILPFGGSVWFVSTPRQQPLTYRPNQTRKSGRARGPRRRRRS